MNLISQSKLLSRKEASEYLGTKKGTLAVWASNKRYGLPVVKIGRLVKYRQVDLDAFIERHIINDETCDELQANGDKYAK